MKLEILTTCLVTLIALSIGAHCMVVFGQDDSNFTMNKAIHQLKQLFRSIEVSTNNRQDSTLSILPPKYMLELYQKYSQDLLPYKESSSVRCILGKVKRESVHFNLTSISPNEQIVHSEVHVFSRKSRHGKLARTKFKLRVKSSPNKFLSTVIPLASGRGWQILDVTKTVRSFKQKKKYLRMTVEAPIPAFGSGKEKYYTLALEEILYTAYKPFLLVYTRDYREMSFPLMQSSLEPNSNHCANELNQVPKKSFSIEKHLDDFDKLENSLMIMLNVDTNSNDINSSRNRSTTEKDNEIEHLDPFNLKQLNDDGEIHFMNKRSVQDNQLTPDDFEAYHSPFNFVSPLLQQDNSFPTLQISNNNDEDEDSDEVEEEEGKADEADYNTLMLPFSQKRKSMRFRPKKMGGKRSGQIRWKDSSNGKHFALRNRETGGNIHKLMTSTSSPISESCRIGTFSVNFNNDWAGKVIAPPAFAFNYCQGMCSDSKEDSFVDDQIPNWSLNEKSSSCCIPAERKRFSVLFVDVHQNIVLRSFLNSTIATCECRQNISEL